MAFNYVGDDWLLASVIASNYWLEPFVFNSSCLVEFVGMEPNDVN